MVEAAAAVKFARNGTLDPYTGLAAFLPLWGAAVGVNDDVPSDLIYYHLVRAILAAVPEWDIPRGVTGAVYRDLRRQGVLVPVGTERSDDVKGGNAGRLIETFRLVTA